MEYLPLISALVGTIIGSLSSIGTLLIQSHYQTKREMKKLAIESALKDFTLRMEDKTGELPQHPMAILVNFYDKLLELVSKNQLTPQRMRGLLYQQAELADMIQQVQGEWNSSAEQRVK
jgi:hypothetical protein